MGNIKDALEQMHFEDIVEGFNEPTRERNMNKVSNIKILTEALAELNAKHAKELEDAKKEYWRIEKDVQLIRDFIREQTDRMKYYGEIPNVATVMESIDEYCKRILKNI